MGRMASFVAEWRQFALKILKSFQVDLSMLFFLRSEVALVSDLRPN